MSEHLVEVANLSVSYRAQRSNKMVVALNGVSIYVDGFETLGVVGESGSGKSTLGKALLGLIDSDSGRIFYKGNDITHLRGKRRRWIYEKIQVVFQDPYSSLNPSRTIGQTLAEPLRFVRGVSGREADSRVAAVLGQVGLTADAMEKYPSAFSGGQRQRIAIARALMCEPKLIVCDEPTSALDLSVQAQILNLLTNIQSNFGVSYIFISHDIDVVRYMSHRIAVMLRGEIVESGQTEVVVGSPANEYTQKLIAAAPG